ncbi:hppA, partial [Symbiodinium microadriaticum]
MSVDQIVVMSIIGSIISILMCVYLTQKMKTYDRGSEKMQKLSDLIASGSRAFLVSEYKYLSAFVATVGIILLIMFSASASRNDDSDGIRVASCFIAGAALSAAAGWVGMIVATDANCRTTHAADKLGLNGRDSDDISSADIAEYPDRAIKYQWAAESLAGFGFGASSIALFARVTGGIYTKAADVGADLVGKVEHGIPEDDPRNPAVIADNVGDNVGDVAGMGADLFESFVGSIIATVTLSNGDVALMALPFWIAGAGVLSSFIGYWF